MNRKQEWILGIGSLVMVLFHLFPPMYMHTDTIVETGWRLHCLFERPLLVVLHVPAYLFGVVTIALATLNGLVLLRARPR